MNRSSLTRYAWLSIGAAILTISLKAAAYFLAGSAGLLYTAVLTHLESMDDESAWQDLDLDRT